MYVYIHILHILHILLHTLLLLARNNILPVPAAENNLGFIVMYLVWLSLHVLYSHKSLLRLTYASMYSIYPSFWWHSEVIGRYFLVRPGQEVLTKGHTYLVVKEVKR